MSRYRAGAAWMAGRIIPVAEAKIPVTDWGFTHCDATYDVVQVWDGAFFRLDDHLDRFFASLAKSFLKVEPDRDGIARILEAICARSGLRNAYCAFVATRGLPTVPGTRDPRLCENRFFAWVVPYVNVIADEVLARGAKLKLAANSERISPRAVDPTAKNYHWGDITRGLFEALEEGYDTVVLADGDGNLNEGPGFNVFMVSGGEVATPRSGVLGGITRRTVLEICDRLAIPAAARDIPVAEFLAADEVFLTSSGGGVLPIVNVNGRVLGNGAPGPVTARLRETYFAWRQAERFRTPITYADG